MKIDVVSSCNGVVMPINKSRRLNITLHNITCSYISSITIGQCVCRYKPSSKPRHYILRAMSERDYFTAWVGLYTSISVMWIFPMLSTLMHLGRSRGTAGGGHPLGHLCTWLLWRRLDRKIRYDSYKIKNE